MAVSVYFDASVLVSLFANDALTARAEAYLRVNPSAPVISDFAATEFLSAIARRVRMRILSANEAQAVFSTFDQWAATKATRERTTSADIESAVGILRRLDLALRAPDAINIAIAQRIGAELLTFDEQMAAEARTLGTTVLLP